jgi:hypothetical protein
MLCDGLQRTIRAKLEATKLRKCLAINHLRAKADQVMEEPWRVGPSLPKSDAAFASVQNAMGAGKVQDVTSGNLHPKLITSRWVAAGNESQPSLRIEPGQRFSVQSAGNESSGGVGRAGQQAKAMARGG